MILVFGGLIDFEEKKIEIIFLIVFVSYCSFFFVFAFVQTSTKWYSK